MAARSILKTKQVRYLLGLSSPAEREHIELEYFEDEDAFQEMLTAEDDLIDAYARGELSTEERRRFESSSLAGRDRVRFARAFARTVSATGPVEPKLPATLFDIFKTFQLPGLLRTAIIAAVIVFVAVLAWLVIDRRRITNELRELRAESAELKKRTEPLQRSDNTEGARTAENAVQLADQRAQPDKPKRREHKRIAPINTQDATLNKPFERRNIIELPLNAGNVANLLNLHPATTHRGYVGGSRADQSNITLEGVDVNESLNTRSLMRQNLSSSGGTTFRGTVQDPMGNLVSSATVTLTDPARNFTRTQSTNEEGAYVFNAIPPGTYSLNVTAPGFKTASASGLVTLVDSPTVLDVQLEVGVTSETIDVTATAEAPIHTSDATLGNSVERRRSTELPLIANKVASLLSLHPGVSRTGFVDAGRTDQSSIRFDAVDATIHIQSSLSWIRFQLELQRAAAHEDYRVIIKTADGHPVTSVDWIEPLTPNQTIIDTPVISTGDLPSGDYVLLLMGKEPDGSFVKFAEYSFKVIKY